MITIRDQREPFTNFTDVQLHLGKLTSNLPGITSARANLFTAQHIAKSSKARFTETEVNAPLNFSLTFLYNRLYCCTASDPRDKPL